MRLNWVQTKPEHYESDSEYIEKDGYHAELDLGEYVAHFYIYDSFGMDGSVYSFHTYVIRKGSSHDILCETEMLHSKSENIELLKRQCIAKHKKMFDDRIKEYKKEIVDIEERMYNLIDIRNKAEEKLY